MFTPF